MDTVGFSQPIVKTGDGQNFLYGGVPAGGYQPPEPGTINSLYALPGFTGFTETAPDGTVFVYNSIQGSNPGVLLSVQNPAGATWTLSYDSSNRVSTISDPVGRSTTLSYSATSNKITSIQDSFGRRTSFSVNSAGNLNQIISPELCVVSVLYDSSNRPIAWTNPVGDITSYGFDSSNRMTSVQAPLGQRTSFTYNTNQTVIQNPLGYVTTLNFNSMGGVQTAIDGAGNLTSYAWDTNNNLLAITDAIGGERGDDHAAAWGCFHIYVQQQQHGASGDRRGPTGQHGQPRLEYLWPANGGD